jgi:hypothetical protein
MDAYIYKAALHCKRCARLILADSFLQGASTKQAEITPVDRIPYDGDDFPF